MTYFVCALLKKRNFILNDSNLICFLPTADGSCRESPISVMFKGRLELYNNEIPLRTPY
jgi:hypothetical protein